jgi:hypothetical protein
VSTPATASRRTREPQRRPQPETEPPHRCQQAEAEGDHAERRPHAQDELRGRGEVGGVPIAADAGEEQIGARHDQARQQGGKRGAGEAAVRLEDTGQHDADAVEHHLRGEDDEESRSQIDLCSIACPEQQSSDRLGQDGDRDGERREDEQGPAEQRRRRPADLLAVAHGDPAREHRHDQAGQRAAGHDLEDDVRHVVGGQVGVTGAVGADSVGEDQRAAEAGHAGQQGEDGDQRRRARDPLGELPAAHATGLFTAAGGRAGPAPVVPVWPR